MNVEVKRRGDDTRVDSRTTSSRSISFSGLSYDTEYTAYVDGRYMQSFTIRNMSSHSDPTNVRVKKTASQSVEVTWSSTSGDVLVELKRRNESYTTSSRTASSRSASFSGLDESTQYEVYIDGEYMTSFTIRDLSDDSEARNVVVRKNGSSIAEISWEGTTEEVHVEIKRRSDNTVVDARWTSSRSASFGSLSPNIEYAVYIDGVYMDYFTLDGTSQQQPQGLTVRQNAAGHSAELSWSGTSGSAEVMVVHEGYPISSIKTSDLKTTVYGLQGGQQYIVYINNQYIGSFVFEQASLFRDVQRHWAQAPIEQLARSGVISGFPDGTFRPNAAVTREQFVIMLVKGMKYPLSNPKNTSFKDIPANHRTAQHIYTAVQKGILVPKEYGSLFSPLKPITREEMAVMVARAVKYAADERALPFRDKNNIKNKGLVGAVVKRGILKGLPDNTFRPANTLTRAEAAAVISRI